MVKTYTARKRCRIGKSWREYGQPVPEAHTWRTVMSSVHAGRLREVEMDETEFRAAVQEHCPELAERVYLAAGLGYFDAAAPVEPEPIEPEPIEDAPADAEPVAAPTPAKRTKRVTGKGNARKPRVPVVIGKPEPVGP